MLWLERRSHHLLLQVSLDAEQRAPAVLQLGTLLQWQLEPVGYLEQVLADVPEPVLLDRLLQMFGARCLRARDVAPLVTCATGIGPVIMRVTSRHRSSPHRAHAQDLLAYRYPGQFRCLQDMHRIDRKLPQARSKAAVTGCTDSGEPGARHDCGNAKRISVAGARAR